jgi:hypothetical protein
MPRFANGGSVEVQVSPGEFFIHPQHVMAFGDGNHEKGSSLLDDFVTARRKKNIAEQQSIPQPH